MPCWLNGAPPRPGKTSADPAKLTPPPRRSRTPLTLSKKANHTPSESDNSLVSGRITQKRATFDLEADGDKHPSRLAHQPIHRQKRPLMVSAAGKKEGGRQVISQVAKVAAALSSRSSRSSLAQLGRGVVAQLGFLGGDRKNLTKECKEIAQPEGAAAAGEDSLLEWSPRLAEERHLSQNTLTAYPKRFSSSLDDKAARDGDLGPAPTLVVLAC